jgi:hypothetical protein
MQCGRPRPRGWRRWTRAFMAARRRRLELCSGLQVADKRNLYLLTHRMPFSHITNGQSAGTGIATLNGMMDVLNAITPTGDSLSTAADEAAAAAVIGSTGGYQTADAGLAALYGPDGELNSSLSLSVFSADYGDIAGFTLSGWGRADVSLISGEAALKFLYGDETALHTGKLVPPTSLSTNRTWTLPDADGTVALMGQLGSMATQSGSNVTITGGSATGLANFGVSAGNNAQLTGFNLGTSTGTTATPLRFFKTWNNSGLTDEALCVDITGTAYNAASSMFAVKLNGQTHLSVGRTAAGASWLRTQNNFSIGNAAAALAAPSFYGAASGQAGAATVGGFVLTEGIIILGGVRIVSVAANPEGVVTAPPGSMALSTTGAWYQKATGSGNTGWVLK